LHKNQAIRDFSDLSSLSHKRSHTVAHVDNPKFVKELTLNRDKVVQLQANLTILKEMKVSKLRSQL
jgi:hypothetical protein